MLKLLSMNVCGSGVKHGPWSERFESDNPSMRIDYAWVNRPLHDLAAAIAVVGDVCRGRVRPSDHFGLLLALAIEP